VISGAITLHLSASALDAGIGITTSMGFAHLTETIPPERKGQTMRTIEMGRELGDAGGPLRVSGIAADTSLAPGLGARATVLACMAALCVRQPLSRTRTAVKVLSAEPWRTTPPSAYGFLVSIRRRHLPLKTRPQRCGLVQSHNVPCQLQISRYD
jgi:hypothetical protein